MSKLVFETTTIEEFRHVARELGLRLVYYFDVPEIQKDAGNTTGLKVLRLDLEGERDIGKSAFQEVVAQYILFGTPIAPPELRFIEMAYDRLGISENKTRQAIFIDACGITEHSRIPERRYSGPLFVQHPQQCNASNCGIEIAGAETLVRVEFEKIDPQDPTSQRRRITISTAIPDFPAGLMAENLKARGIHVAPTLCANY